MGRPPERVSREDLDPAAATNRESEAAHYKAPQTRANEAAGEAEREGRTRLLGDYLVHQSGPRRVARRPRSNGNGKTILLRIAPDKGWTQWLDPKSGEPSEAGGDSPRTTHARRDSPVARSLVAPAAERREGRKERDVQEL